MEMRAGFVCVCVCGGAGLLYACIYFNSAPNFYRSFKYAWLSLIPSSQHWGMPPPWIRLGNWRPGSEWPLSLLFPNKSCHFFGWFWGHRPSRPSPGLLLAIFSSVLDFGLYPASALILSQGLLSKSQVRALYPTTDRYTSHWLLPDL